MMDYKSGLEALGTVWFRTLWTLGLISHQNQLPLMASIFCQPEQFVGLQLVSYPPLVSGIDTHQMEPLVPSDT